MQKSARVYENDCKFKSRVQCKKSVCVYFVHNNFTFFEMLDGNLISNLFSLPFCYLFHILKINIAMKLQWGLIYYVRLAGTLSLRQYFNKCELILQGQFAWLWNRYNWRTRELQKGWLKGHLVGNNKGEGGGCSEQHYYLICCGSSFRFFFSFFILILIRCKLYKILSFSFSLSLSNI